MAFRRRTTAAMFSVTSYFIYCVSVAMVTWTGTVGKTLRQRAMRRSGADTPEHVQHRSLLPVTARLKTEGNLTQCLLTTEEQVAGGIPADSGVN